MSGAVFGTMIVAAAVVLIVGAAPVLLIPIVVIALGALALSPLLAALRGSRTMASPGPSGVPSTSEAAYDPVKQP